MQSAPDSLVTGELRRVAGSRPPGPWLRSLAARDRGTWRDLDRALRAAHRHLVEAAWPRILSAFRSDLAWRARMIGEFGAQAAISSLHPGIGWNGTVLQIETPKELDFHPGGAGLTLMPTAMWTGRAMVAGGDDDRHLALAAQPGQQVENPGGGMRVQVAGRLVGQQQVRGVDHGPGDGDSLLFAA
jgi:hypothetical protein